MMNRRSKPNEGIKKAKAADEELKTEAPISEKDEVKTAEDRTNKQFKDARGAKDNK